MGVAVKKIKKVSEKLGEELKQKSLNWIHPVNLHFKKFFDEENGNWVTIIYNPQLFQCKNNNVKPIKK